MFHVKHFRFSRWLGMFHVKHSHFSFDLNFPSSGQSGVYVSRETFAARRGSIFSFFKELCK